MLKYVQFHTCESDSKYIYACANKTGVVAKKCVEPLPSFSSLFMSRAPSDVKM